MRQARPPSIWYLGHTTGATSGTAKGLADVPNEVTKVTACATKIIYDMLSVHLSSSALCTSSDVVYAASTRLSARAASFWSPLCDEPSASPFDSSFIISPTPPHPPPHPLYPQAKPSAFHVHALVRSPGLARQPSPPH